VISGLIQALVVVGVLAGVVAMHGLTANHEATMPTTAAGHKPAADARAAGHAMSSGEVAPEPQSAGSQASAVLRLTGAGDGHGMTGACVAILATTLLFLALVLALRFLRVWHPLDAAIGRRRSFRSSAAGRSPPRRAPSLSMLCVLRT
jgi:hypothetical protein